MAKLETATHFQRMKKRPKSGFMDRNLTTTASSPVLTKQCRHLRRPNPRHCRLCRRSHRLFRQLLFRRAWCPRPQCHHSSRRSPVRAPCPGRRPAAPSRMSNSFSVAASEGPARRSQISFGGSTLPLNRSRAAICGICHQFQLHRRHLHICCLASTTAGSPKEKTCMKTTKRMSGRRCGVEPTTPYPMRHPWRQHLG